MVHPATRRQTINVQALPAERLTCAAALIAASFRHEGFTRHTHNLSTPARQQRFAEAGALRLWLNQASGHQILAASQEQTLAGVAVVKSPTARSVPWFQLLWVVVRRAPRLLPILGDLRWRQALRIKPALQPPATLPRACYTLDLLAVAPDFQGQGIGRLLLEHIHAHCDPDQHASGIYLYTGDEHNTQIYQRFGYHVLQTSQGGALTVWHMFRPRPG
jgi:GNAT superfamily N-acetyltransferase